KPFGGTRTPLSTADALKYRDGRFAVFEHLVSQLPRRRDDGARGQRTAAIPFLAGARGHHLLVGASGGVVGANGVGTPFRSGHLARGSRRGGRRICPRRFRLCLRGLLGPVGAE